MLASCGARATFVGFNPPFYDSVIKRAGIECCVPEIYSDAYPHSDGLRMLAVAEELYRRALEAIGRDRRVVFLASFLFPFHQAAAIAAERLRGSGFVCHIIAIPAGSDIWQIGYQVPGAVRWLLSPTKTDIAVVYSRRFASEVRELTGSGACLRVIPPPVDTRIFCPASTAIKNDLRDAMRIPRGSVVLLHCSNLRPVKRLDSILELAMAAAKISRRRLLLLIVGPWTTTADELFSKLGLRERQGVFARTKVGRLEIAAVGLQSDTVPFHQVSDMVLNASVHDSFNTSLAESMACGLPVITSDIVGVAGLVRRYRCGYLYSYPSNALNHLRQGIQAKLSRESVRGAAEYICELAERSDIREEVGRRSTYAVSRHCDMNRVTERWIGLLDRLTSAC
jgi:glycosyltransferase involved in cell wall biosynthesis